MKKKTITIDVRAEENLDSNLANLQILYKEIDITLSEIQLLLEEKARNYKIHNTHSAQEVRILNLIEDPEQIKINLNCKIFLFVFRQFISKYFRTLYQSKEVLGFENVASKLPDLSVDGGIKKKLINLLKDRYDFDKDIINVIHQGSDFLIISRLLRNSIKKYAVLITHSIHENDTTNFQLNYPIDGEIKDETMLYVKEKLIDLKGSSNFTIKIGFFENCLLYAENLHNILIQKLHEKNYFEN